jgi:hypothetical protein
VHPVPRKDDGRNEPIRGIRVSDELWLAALRVAADRGETVSEVVRRALERYVREWPGPNGD